MSQHVFTPEEGQRAREKALSPESRKKRKETWARYRAEDREAVRILWAERRMVPLAIADALFMPIRTVAKHLRELEREGVIGPIPPHLSLSERDS
jgi:hypothetical protein